MYLHGYMECDYMAIRRSGSADRHNTKEVSVAITQTEEQGASPGDGSAAGMIAWLGWVIDKNEMVDATAGALRTGCQKVLAVEDDWNSLDVRGMDVDSIVTRFRNKHRGDMKTSTLDAYEQRLRQSVDMYVKWLNDDPTWKPAQRRRATKAANGNGTTPGAAVKVKQQEQAKVDPPPQPGMITYPFPIRPGMQGKITLPENLSMREAKRIAAFVSTLAFEDEPEPMKALPAGQWGSGDE